MFAPGRAGGAGVLVWDSQSAVGGDDPEAGRGRYSGESVQVAYHTGTGWTAHQYPGEFTRQLDAQFRALSAMSAQEVLDNIKAYGEAGRAPDGREVAAARRKFEENIANSLVKRHGLSEADARVWARGAMEVLAVLHNPDQLFAGPGSPLRGRELGGEDVGLGNVNSAIGSQSGGAPRRIIEDAARRAVEEGRGGCRLRLRVVLTADPDLARDLNGGAAVLERVPDRGRGAVPTSPSMDWRSVAGRIGARLGADPDPGATTRSITAPGGESRADRRKRLEALRGTVCPPRAPAAPGGGPPPPAPTAPGGAPGGLRTPRDVANSIRAPGRDRTPDSPAPTAPDGAPGGLRTPRDVISSIRAPGRNGTPTRDRTPDRTTPNRKHHQHR